MNVFGTGNLGFDDSQVLRVGQAVRLHRVWLRGRGHQCWRVLGAVTALGEALVGQALWEGKTTATVSVQGPAAPLPQPEAKPKGSGY